MGEKTKIEWCDYTFNPWIGCTKVSPGCDRCYAEALMDTRYGRIKWGPHGERVRTSEANWKLPLRWQRHYVDLLQGFDEGMLTHRPPRPRVFCASLADIWDNQVPPPWRADLFDLIRRTPHLDWLLLTKRPENIEKMLPTTIKNIGLSRNPPNMNPQDLQLPWPNVWLGFTAEDQDRFDHRWKIMREIPAAVRFCSYEPAIGPLRLPADTDRKLHWLICGGESGAGYREMSASWERNVRDDCGELGISYFFKQMAGKKPIPEGFPVLRQFPRSAA